MSPKANDQIFQLNCLYLTFSAVLVCLVELSRAHSLEMDENYDDDSFEWLAIARDSNGINCLNARVLIFPWLSYIGLSVVKPFIKTIPSVFN